MGPAETCLLAVDNRLIENCCEEIFRANFGKIVWRRQCCLNNCRTLAMPGGIAMFCAMLGEKNAGSKRMRRGAFAENSASGSRPWKIRL